MKNSIYVFYYAKELLTLSVFLTLGYVLSYLFSLPFGPLIITAKIVLPFVFFAVKKMSNQSDLYFLYNFGMRNRTILFWLFFFTTVDVSLLQFILT